MPPSKPIDETQTNSRISIISRASLSLSSSIPLPSSIKKIFKRTMNRSLSLPPLEPIDINFNNAGVDSLSVLALSDNDMPLPPIPSSDSNNTSASLNINTTSDVINFFRVHALDQSPFNASTSKLIKNERELRLLELNNNSKSNDSEGTPNTFNSPPLVFTKPADLPGESSLLLACLYLKNTTDTAVTTTTTLDTDPNEHHINPSQLLDLHTINPTIPPWAKLAGSSHHLHNLDMKFTYLKDLVFPNGEGRNAGGRSYKLGVFHPRVVFTSNDDDKSHGLNLKKATSASLLFAAALQSSSPNNVKPLKDYLIGTYYYVSSEMADEGLKLRRDDSSDDSSTLCDPFPEEILSEILVVLQMIKETTLISSDHVPLLPDLALLLCLPSSPSPSSPHDLKPSAAYKVLLTLLNPPTSKSRQTTLRAKNYVNDPTHKSYLAQLRTYERLITKFYPKTAKVMHSMGAFHPSQLSCIFERFFTCVLPVKYCKRILQMFILEGGKVLMRFAVGLVGMLKTRIKDFLSADNYNSEGGRRRSISADSTSNSFFTPNPSTNPNPSFWDILHQLTHSSTFNFPALCQHAFGSFGSMSRRRPDFPSRSVLDKMNKAFEVWGDSFYVEFVRVRRLEEEEYKLKRGVQGHGQGQGQTSLIPGSVSSRSLGSLLIASFSRSKDSTNKDDDDDIVVSLTSPKATEDEPLHALPIILRANSNPGSTPAQKQQENEGTKLGRSENTRLTLARWVPSSKQGYKLDLLYSSEVHGRALETLYDKCHRCGPTVMLIEVLGDDGLGKGNGKEGEVIGMYASHEWCINNTVYGDGTCFVFQVQPKEVMFGWKPYQSVPAENVSEENGEMISVGAIPITKLKRVATDITDIPDNDEVGLKIDIDEEDKVDEGPRTNHDINSTKLTFNSTTSKEEEEIDSSGHHHRKHHPGSSEQFMVSTPNFLAIGLNTSGGAAIKLTSDLKKGFSDRSLTFCNEPLVRTGGFLEGAEFEVGVVEMYCFRNPFAK